MSNQELSNQQGALADDAFESYNFGADVTVVGAEGWQRDTFDGKDDWTKVVYVECDDDESEADSHKVSFHAAFVEGTATLDEAYAYWCESGTLIGTPGNGITYEAGDKVFVRREKRLATVLSVYGDGVNGDQGEIRLDLCGNTDVSEIEPYDVSRHSQYDSTFQPIKRKWKAEYGITKDVELRD